MKKNKIEGYDIGQYDNDGGRITWFKLKTFATLEEAQKEVTKRHKEFEKEFGHFPDFEDFVHIRPFKGKKYVDDDEKDFPEPNWEELEDDLYTSDGQYLG